MCRNRLIIYFSCFNGFNQRLYYRYSDMSRKGVAFRNRAGLLFLVAFDGFEPFSLSCCFAEAERTASVVSTCGQNKYTMSGSAGSESGLFGADFATTKNGGKRSMASQIRFRKTLRATIPPTLLLDGRMAVDLQTVKEPKQKLDEIRSGPATTVLPENEVPKLTDPRLVAEIQKFKLPRNPASANQLLILEPVLCEFVKKFSRSRLKELYQRMYARACLVVAALQRKCAVVVAWRCTSGCPFPCLEICLVLVLPFHSCILALVLPGRSHCTVAPTATPMATKPRRTAT